MREAVIWLCVLGCSYGPARIDPTLTPDDAPPTTDAPVTTPDAPIDPDAPPPPVGCAIVPAGQVACFQFEDNFAGGTFADGSGNNHDATASGFTAIERDVPTTSQAAQVGNAASALVAQAADLELTADFTLTAWIRPIDPNVQDNEGIFDHEGQWAMSIEFGELACWFSRPGLTKIKTASFTNNVWQFVACRMTGAEGCTVRIPAVSGAVTNVCQTLSTDSGVGRNGISLGSFQDGGGAAVQRFNGAVDDLRVYARALSDAELCTLAGRTSCP